MAWCCQAPSHYLCQCWHRPISPLGVNSNQWVHFPRTLISEVTHKWYITTCLSEVLAAKSLNKPVVVWDIESDTEAKPECLTPPHMADNSKGILQPLMAEISECIILEDTLFSFWYGWSSIPLSIDDRSTLLKLAARQQSVKKLLPKPLIRIITNAILLHQRMFNSLTSGRYGCNF